MVLPVPYQYISAMSCLLVTMGCWTCSLCPDEGQDRWPSKQQALEHIEEEHMDTLLRASLERKQKDPNVALEMV